MSSRNRNRKRSNRVNEKKKTYPQYEGTAKMSRDGMVFVAVEGMEEEIVIKGGKTAGALHGDKVRVALTRPAAGGKRPEGRIVEVTERSAKPFVGVLHVTGSQAWVLMQSKNMPYDIEIDVLAPDGTPLRRSRGGEKTTQRSTFGALRRTPEGELKVVGVTETVGDQAVELTAVRGMKVAARVDRWDRGEVNPHGYLVDVLGKSGSNDTEMHAILAEYGLPYRFDPEVQNAADKISDRIGPEELQGRRDFRDTLTFTIDPSDAKDFDDALSFKPLDNGNFEIGVHIADVSWYVRPGSAVDKEARERGTSVYLVDRTVPMLPEKLSNKLCSLRPAEDKLTFSAVFEMSPAGKVASSWFGRTVIRSDWRFAYETAQQIIDMGPEALEAPLRGGTDGSTGVKDSESMSGELYSGSLIPRPVKEAVLELWNLAKILRDKRFAAGAVSFERPEMKVLVDAEGRPVDVRQHVSAEANWLIEEFMLLANRSVAEFVATGGKMNGKARKDARTFVYRIHDEPNGEKLGSLSRFASTFGYKATFGQGRAAAKQLNALLGKAKDKPEFMALEMIALRSMAKACYSTDNIGHYGLAFDFYTHFTSPIRRYPDLMVHRLLASCLSGGASADKEKFEQECKHASEREVIAATAERDSIKYKLVEFMQDKVGAEFTGHISGLTEWGMYVEVEPTKIEGMVPLREIRTDFFSFDEENYRLVGRRSSQVFRLGDEVRVRVKSTNLEQRLLDYELVLPQEAEVPRPAARSPRKDSRPRKKLSSSSKKR